VDGYVSKLQLKCEELIDYGYIALKQYPAEERFVLSQKVRECMWELETLIIKGCDARDKRDKISWMRMADKELTRLIVLWRMGYRLKYLPMKKYERLSYLNDELGRMIGAWMRRISQ
jgi:four helix bundle protein